MRVHRRGVSMNELVNGTKVFLIGIGGIGMSALAVILKARGFDVLGSDRADSTVILNLRKLGINVALCHESANITPDIRTVVYTNAVSEDNPELIKAREIGASVYERAAMLDLLSGPKLAIGVSGTHGKTTTTSMVAKIFLAAGLDPTLAVGGHIDQIGGSGYEGDGKFFVYEACEAYGSFLKLHPAIAVITNIDSDHLDYYTNIGNIKKAFLKYIQENIPAFGTIVYNRDDANLRSVVEGAKLHNTVSVGIRHRADFTASKIRLNEFSSSFVVKKHGAFYGNFFLNVPGMHNVTNALLAISCSAVNGISCEVMQNTLKNFKNADRRFQLKFNNGKLMVIDDYAHHPSEIDATLNAAKNLSEKSHARLIAVFQPHLYSRTQSLYKEFARSLSRADSIVLTEIYAAREKNDGCISTKLIYDEIVRIKGKENVALTSELKDIPEMVRSFFHGKNIVITLGAGDVWKVSDMFCV
jgi:UDP-N-acetylmuramate--alanine ligase